MTTDLEELRYPVGRFQRRGAMTPEERTAAIDEIAGLPRKLRDAVENLSDEQLDTVAGGGFIKSDDRDARHPAKLEIPNLKVTFSAADAE